MQSSDAQAETRYVEVGETNLFEIVIDPPNGFICSEVIISGYNLWLTPGTEAISTSDVAIGEEVLVSAGSIIAAQQDLDNDGLADDFQVFTTVPRTINPSGIYEVTCQDLTRPGTPLAKTSFTLAQRIVSVIPSAGPPRTTVTINSTGWCPGDHNGVARLLYGNGWVGVDFITDIIVDDQGNFTVSGKIPWLIESGLHLIMIFFNPDNPGIYDSANSNCISYQCMFTVTHRDLIVEPDNNVPMGHHVTLSGGDFGPPAAGGTPELWVNYQRQPFDEIDNQQLTSNGDIVPVTFELSRDLGFNYGENIVEIRTTIDGFELSAAATCEIVRPTFEITPDEGYRGTTVTVTGEHWLAGETSYVTIYYTDPSVGTETAIAIAKPEQNGDIWAQFKIPPFILDHGAFGYTILLQAKDGDGPASNSSQQLLFRIKPQTISIDPKEGVPGEEVTVTGKGFVPFALVQEISIGDAPNVPAHELPLTSGTGSFKATGTVPGVIEGGHLVKVRVTQDEGYEITDSFNVKSGGTGSLRVEEVFDIILDKLVTVWTFDEDAQEWRIYEPNLPAWVPNFATMTPGQGYWVKVTEDCTWDIFSARWDLKAPWNLIGFCEAPWYEQPQNIEEVFDSVIDKLLKIWTFDENVQEWLVWDNTSEDAPKLFTTMHPGQGYWIEVSEEVIWRQGVYSQILKEPWNLIGYAG